MMQRCLIPMQDRIRSAAAPSLTFCPRSRMSFVVLAVICLQPLSAWAQTPAPAPVNKFRPALKDFLLGQLTTAAFGECLREMNGSRQKHEEDAELLLQARNHALALQRRRVLNNIKLNASNRMAELRKLTIPRPQDVRDYLETWGAWKNRTYLQTGSNAAPDRSGYVQDKQDHVNLLGEESMKALTKWAKRKKKTPTETEFAKIIDQMKPAGTGRYRYKKLTLEIQFAQGAGNASFHPDPNDPTKCTITIDPTTLNDNHKTGQMMVACHEFGHFLKYAMKVDRALTVRRAYKQWEDGPAAHGRYLDKDGTPIKQSAAGLAAYAEEEVFVEKFALAVVEYYLGSVCDSLRRYSNRYALVYSFLMEGVRDQFAVGVGLFTVLKSKLESVLSAFVQGRGTPGGGSSAARRAGRLASRLARHEQSRQRAPVFGGLLLGNEVTADRLELIDVTFSMSAGEPVIKMTVRDREGTHECRYQPGSATELWVAYHVLKPTAIMREKFRLDGMECNLLGAQADSLGKRVVFGIHPALAHTPIATAGCRLDALWAAGAPGLFDELDLQSSSMQWYDEPAVCRLRDGQLVVEAKTGPKGILLRARFWGLDAKQDRTAASQRILGDVMQQLALDPGNASGPLSKAQFQRVLQQHAQQAAASLSGNRPIASGPVIEKNLSRYPSLRTVDSFAKTLAVLHWIDDGKIPLPELPEQVLPELIPVMPRLSLIELAKQLRPANKELLTRERWDAPATDKLPAGTKTYAVYISGLRRGWRTTTQGRRLQQGKFVDFWEQRTRLAMTDAEAKATGVQGSGAFEEQVKVVRNGPELLEYHFKVVGVNDFSWTAKRSGNKIAITSVDSKGKTSETTVELGRVRFLDFFDKLPRLKPGEQPIAFPLATATGVWIVRLSPKHLEEVEVLSESRRLLRVEVECFRDQPIGAGPQTTGVPALFFPKKQTWWINERGRVQKVRQFSATSTSDKLLEHPYVQRMLKEGVYKLDANNGPGRTFVESKPQVALAIPELEGSADVSKESSPRSAPVIKTDRPMFSSDAMDRIVLRLSFRDELNELPILTTPHQLVKRVDAKTVELTLKSQLANAVSEAKGSAPDDLLDLCRQPSSFINSRERSVAQLARAVLPRETDAWKKAQELELLTWRVLAKTYKYRFLTASQALAVGGGDCTEHAVLLAAFARARGIPARLVFGFRYSPDFVGFVAHAWVEVWTDGHWRGLDGTTASGGIDATYIATDHVPAALPISNLLSRFQAFSKNVQKLTIVETSFPMQSARTTEELRSVAVRDEPPILDASKKDELRLAAFELGGRLGNWVESMEMYGAEHSATQREATRVEAASAALGISAPAVIDPCRSTEIAPDSSPSLLPSRSWTYHLHLP